MKDVELYPRYIERFGSRGYRSLPPLPFSMWISIR